MRRGIHGGKQVAAVFILAAALSLVGVCASQDRVEGFGATPEAMTPAQACSRHGEWVATVGEVVDWRCMVGGVSMVHEVREIPVPEPIVSPVIPWERRGGGITANITQYYCAFNGGFYGDGGGYCGVMRWGSPVYAGAAACGGYWPAKAVLHVEGWGNVVCEDTGHLGWTQVDIFVYYSADLRMSHMMVPWRVTRLD